MTDTPTTTDRAAVVAAGYDPAKPEEAVAAAVARVSRWGRWGADDVLGSLNLLTPAKRIEGAACVRTGVAFSLSQPFDEAGPQHGWKKRTNPVHTMLGTGHEALDGEFPHGIGGADDIIAMPLQCSTQWDGLGHIFDHGKAWNGREAAAVVRVEGDRLTGIETAAAHIAGRGVLLDAGRVLGDEKGELPDSYPITAHELDEVARAHGVEVRPGDIVCVRTGQYARTRREGWGGYAGGPAPGLSFTTLDWLHDSDIAAIATDTWGVEVRPNEFEVAFQPLHQVAIPHLGLFLGEMWDLDGLAADCAADGRHDFFLTAAPLRITGAVGSPVNPIAVK
ncbi:cyclase family protein [Actinomycetospora lutea]|uniref:cyclase family protein n=1 Tax=Actinomycetospora lutea TaxID=663604 RepID=UPI00236525C0|nr:cyclase family protein [Actinomycetospora lutea]MDD7938918.1 cyclase family protein [Actinomycetospora lutea]